MSLLTVCERFVVLPSSHSNFKRISYILYLTLIVTIYRIFKWFKSFEYCCQAADNKNQCYLFLFFKKIDFFLFISTLYLRIRTTLFSQKHRISCTYHICESLKGCGTLIFGLEGCDYETRQPKASTGTSHGGMACQKGGVRLNSGQGTTGVAIVKGVPLTFTSRYLNVNGFYGCPQVLFLTTDTPSN